MSPHDSVVAETVRLLRPLLLGMSTGKMCFQEVLAIYVAVKETPQDAKGTTLDLPVL